MTLLKEMRTAAECLAMANEMDSRAAQTLVSRQRADFRSMAKRWRSLGRRAAWQDANAI